MKPVAPQPQPTMTIAFYNSHNLWGSHLETELDLIQQHLDQNHTVYQLFCQGELPTCDINPFHDLNDCLKCIARRENGINAIDKKEKIIQQSFLNLTQADKTEIKNFNTSYPNIDVLQDVFIDNFDIGFAVTSSIVTLIRHTNPDLVKEKNLLNRFMLSALATYRSTQNFLDNHKIDKMYVFNGRFAQVKAVLRACQSRNITCLVHERGHNKNHYALFENTIPHDYTYIVGRIKQHWLAADPNQRIQSAKAFFEARINGQEQGWVSFVGKQEKGILPNNWDTSKHNIVVFCSSEDEFVSSSRDFKNLLYKSQLEGIKAMMKSIEGNEKVHLYIRLHPNSADADAVYMQEYLQLTQKNTTVIEPLSKLSTYDLMFAANTTASFGSTIGLEATFWGKPSVLCGVIFYDAFDCTYNPKNHQQTMLWLLDGNLPPKPQENTFFYAHYANSFGIPYQHYQAETLFTGKVNGKIIDDTLPKTNKHKSLKTLRLKRIQRYLNYFHQQIQMLKYKY